jgi:uncharacterized protein (DUF427 family)
MPMPFATVGSPIDGERHVALVPCAKRVRVVVNGRTVAETLRASLLLERGKRPAYYFPREDVRTDLLEPGSHRSSSSLIGEASYWTLSADGRRCENALWSYEDPNSGLAAIKGLLAFDPAKVDHWLEEDEEAFGHPRDPYHRVDIRASARRVRITFAGETVAATQRGLFLFETGHPTRYYIPPQDVRFELLEPSNARTTCPYKGTASYWSLHVGAQTVRDAVWSYQDPLPECPRIKGHLAFYPEKVQIDVEGELAASPGRSGS